MLEKYARRKKKRSRAQRRRMLYVRRTLVLLAGAALMALLIVATVWVVRWISSGTKPLWMRDDDDRNSLATTSATVDPQAVTKPTAIPAVDEDTVALGSKIQSEHAVLLDMTTGRVIASKNSDTLANPASITKVMTLLVAVENIDNLDAEYTVPWQVTTHVALDATRAGLNSGDVFILRDLLYGCILPSGADAAVALAHYVVGDQAADVAEAEAIFAQMMNDRAKELGAKNTNFVNVSGLHHRDHKTTAMDMALIMAAAVKNDVCREVLSTAHYSSENTLRLPASQLTDGTWHSTLFTSWLGSDRQGILAGKTGYTDQALHTLATYAEIGGHQYVFVSMRVKGSSKAVADAHTVYSEFCNP